MPSTTYVAKITTTQDASSRVSDIVELLNRLRPPTSRRGDHYTKGRVIHELVMAYGDELVREKIRRIERQYAGIQVARRAKGVAG